MKNIRLSLFNSKRDNNNLKGFTLSEILIAMVVLGVIAAMTVPAVLTNINKREYRSAFKKTISAVNQALILNYAHEGLSAHDYTSAESVMDMFKSRMNTIDKIGGNGNANTTQTFTNTDICSGSNVWTTTDGAVFCIDSNYLSEYKSSQSSICNSYGTTPCSSDGNANLFIDVNGLRNPNQLTTSSGNARDIYQAMIYAQKVVPYGDAAQQVLYDKEFL